MMINNSKSFVIPEGVGEGGGAGERENPYSQSCTLLTKHTSIPRMLASTSLRISILETDQRPRPGPNRTLDEMFAKLVP